MLVTSHTQFIWGFEHSGAQKNKQHYYPRSTAEVRRKNTVFYLFDYLLLMVRLEDGYWLITRRSQDRNLSGVYTFFSISIH